ncbi:hypothetical protein [Nisaea nitritireducens]|uniref:hypothetical protein n=1 Tax=Nisaea nitritireducens TaxID=568392 RepID=UPI001868EF91|nr:hypothetical protein [Nisaea nitritireducens]
MSDGDGVKNYDLVGHPINIDTVSPLQDVVKNHIDTISESHVRELLQALKKFEASILMKFDKNLAAQNSEGVGLLKVFQDEMATLRHVFYLSSQKLSDSIMHVSASLNIPNELKIITPWYDTFATFWVGVSITPLVVGVAAYIVGKKQNELIANQNAIYDRQNDLYKLDIAQRTYQLKVDVYNEVKGIFNCVIVDPSYPDISMKNMLRVVSESKFLFSNVVADFVAEMERRSTKMKAYGKSIKSLEKVINSGVYSEAQHNRYSKYLDDNQSNLEWFSDNMSKIDELFVPEIRISERE